MAKGQLVGAFVDGLSHARMKNIRALRQIILSADPAVTERVKSNVPGFCPLWPALVSAALAGLSRSFNRQTLLSPKWQAGRETWLRYRPYAA